MIFTLSRLRGWPLPTPAVCQPIAPIAIQTEAGIRVLSLDSLPPVLAEEHIGREGALGSVFVLLGLAAGSSLLSGCLAGGLGLNG